jgi:hypothetical protein
MKLQAFGQSKPEILQSQSQSRPENRFLINRLDGSSRTTIHLFLRDQKWWARFGLPALLLDI